jgi:hypothetical protein
MPESSFHNFKVDAVAMRYSNFAPRLFNFCLSLGMQPHRIMPSRAFCSDENQGYPIILIGKHFGSFPFNHGRVGGIVATDRHGPHAKHGKDSVIIQASHVGYDPETGTFGVYRRLHTENQQLSADCGSLCGVLSWYQEEFAFACQQIQLHTEDAKPVVVIDNQLLDHERDKGLILNLDQLVKDHEVVKVFSTAKSFTPSANLLGQVGSFWPEKKTPIAQHLFPEAFFFRRNSDAQVAGGLLNRNLIRAMPNILASDHPPLAAAQVNAQVEFDRTFRTIVKEKAYRGKKVVFISGIHIDISPSEGQLFPLTKFVPWAAYIQRENGEGYTLEQGELYAALQQQSTENPHKIDLTEAIHHMEKEPEIRFHVD